MVFSRYMPSNGIAGSYESSIFSFLKTLHTVLHNVCINLHPHQQCKRVAFPPHPLHHLVFANFMTMAISDWCEVIPHCSFDLFLLKLVMLSIFLWASSSYVPLGHLWSEVKLLSCVWLFAAPWTVACQAPPSMGFSRQEYWSGLPFPSPEDVPNQKGSDTGLPHCRQTLYFLSLQKTTRYHERNFLPWHKNIMVHVFLFFFIMGICLIYLYNS